MFTPPKRRFFALYKVYNANHMSEKFPPQLISDCQKLLHDQAGIEIDEDQAEIYLEKMGRLMLTIAKIYDEKNNEK